MSSIAVDEIPESLWIDERVWKVVRDLRSGKMKTKNAVRTAREAANQVQIIHEQAKSRHNQIRDAIKRVWEEMVATEERRRRTHKSPDIMAYVCWGVDERAVAEAETNSPTPATKAFNRQNIKIRSNTIGPSRRRFLSLRKNKNRIIS